MNGRWRDRIDHAIVLRDKHDVRAVNSPEAVFSWNQDFRARVITHSLQWRPPNKATNVAISSQTADWTHSRQIFATAQAMPLVAR